MGRLFYAFITPSTADVNNANWIKSEFKTRFWRPGGAWGARKIQMPSEIGFWRGPRHECDGLILNVFDYSESIKG